MKELDILGAIKGLANSQGFYGRLYNTIMEMKENDITSYKRLMEELENQNFKDTLDLIMYIEG